MIPPVTVAVAVETAAKVQALGAGLRGLVMGATLEQGVDGAIDHAMLGYQCCMVLSGQLARAELAVIDMREHSTVLIGLLERAHTMLDEQLALLDQAQVLLHQRQELLEKAYVDLHGDLEGPTELMLALEALERPDTHLSGPTTVEFRTDTATFNAHSAEIIHDLAHEIVGVFTPNPKMVNADSEETMVAGAADRRAETRDHEEKKEL